MVSHHHANMSIGAHPNLRCLLPSCRLPADFYDEYVDSEAESEEADQAASGRQMLPPDQEPHSFSRVDLAASPSQLATDFPDFPGTSAALDVEVNAGAVPGSESAQRPAMLPWNWL